MIEAPDGTPCTLRLVVTDRPNRVEQMVMFAGSPNMDGDGL